MARKTAAKKAVAKKKPAAKKESVKKTTGKPAAKKTAKKKGSAKKKGTCFVLMPFREPFLKYYDEIIEPAIIKIKLEPTRGDSLFRPSAIMADIWQMIQDAKVLVAVLTDKNVNVFYELGLGHAIGKPIVMISETMEDVPFDLQALRILTYDRSNPSWGTKLKNKITISLKDVLNNSSEAVPNIFKMPPKFNSQISITNVEKDVKEIIRVTGGPSGRMFILLEKYAYNNENLRVLTNVMRQRYGEYETCNIVEAVLLERTRNELRKLKLYNEVGCEE